jgi:RNA polymerase sigma-70 factor (ECF subfamily)
MRKREYERAIAPHLDELYGTAVRLTRSRAHAEDLLQETLLRAWAFWDRFESGTNARAWMHRILMNTFINGYRRGKRERELLAEVQRSSSVRHPLWSHRQREEASAGLGDEIQQALSALPDEFRTVVMLVDLSDLSYREAADRLGCPIGTVMSRLHRGRRVLKQRLRDYAAVEGYVREAA